MLKNVKWFFVVLVFSSFISLSFDKRKTPTEKLPLGAQAPELVLGKEKQPLSLQAAKGNYILSENSAAANLQRCGSPGRYRR